MRTAPGHQATLRLIRALVRIARNETTNASRHRNAAAELSRLRSPNGSTLMSAACIALKR